MSKRSEQATRQEPRIKELHLSKLQPRFLM